MNTTAKYDVLQYVWAVEPLFVGVVEPSWILVCRTAQHQYALAASLDQTSVKKSRYSSPPPPPPERYHPKLVGPCEIYTNVRRDIA